jgi:Cytochrome bd terminal oxidase subunit I/Cytochrome bd terminal oxidase subunit II
MHLVLAAAGGASSAFGTPDQDSLFQARQMQALSFAAHIPLVCFGIAFLAFVVFVEWLHLRTGDPLYRTLAQRWSKVMLALFAVGVVTGTILSFEMGLLWPNFMATFGDVFRDRGHLVLRRGDLHRSITSTLAVPLFIAGMGIVLRGTAYALRSGPATRHEQRTVEVAFAGSSILTPFALGTVVGGIASGRVPVGNAAGSLVTSWLNPTSIVLGVLAVATAAYLAAVYLAADAVRPGAETSNATFASARSARPSSPAAQRSSGSSWCASMRVRSGTA